MKQIEGKARLVAAVGLALLASPAMAQFFTGNSLHDACISSPLFVSGWTAGFVEGMTTAANVAANGEETPPQLCIARGVRVDQVRDVICNALSAKPETREWDAAPLAFNAVNAAWPCP